MMLTDDGKPVKKELLIGTVFMDDSPDQLKWFDLQMRYIKATTSASFDHITFLQKGSKDKFQGSKVINQITEDRAKQSRAHIKGLTHLLSYFKKNKEYYDNFLFIDSDAFPIRSNWYDILTKKMNRNFEIAVVIRPENLEQRLHSSILLAKREALDHLEFAFDRHKLKDLMGHWENDVSLGVYYQKVNREKVFPLLKSNKVNVNPLLCSVYYDLFYHNACGTGRDFNMRARPYWQHMVDIKPDVQAWINELMKNPNEFIGKLAGWNPEQYPEV